MPILKEVESFSGSRSNRSIYNRLDDSEGLEEIRKRLVADES